MTSTASEPSEASMGQCSLPGDSRKPSIFTKIIRREVPAKILYEDEMVISFLGLPQNRVTPVQFLVVPKKQLATLEEAHSCDEAALGRMFTVASLVAKQQGVTNGYRLVINNASEPSEASMGQCSLPGDSRKPSIFTKIIRREVPAKILYEDELVISFLGLPQNRVTPVQFLVVPKKQLATLEEANSCDEAALGRMFTVASLVAKQQGVTNGYRLVINNGNDAGQEVPHLHIHVFAGQPMSWPPGTD
uniref:HIT domain-containing protein n=1 Tax=Macrostomum lignano TaxID=282301 RepID=A0A1I8IEX6_9PLAT